MGLLSDLFDQAKAWFLKNIQSWVVKWGTILWTEVTNVYQSIRNTYNTFKEYVTNVYNNVYKYVTNTYNYVTENITNVTKNITENITQNITNITENITNVVGASVEWVEEKLAENRAWMENVAKLMDPTGFLKDPVGTMKAIFALQRQAAEATVVRSFWEGLEEGLGEEAVEPAVEGAGVR